MRQIAFAAALAAILAAARSASAQQQPPGAPPAPYGNMQVGGLAPPPPLPPVAPSPAAVKTEADLDEAKKKDAGRGLEWLWLSIDGGYEHLGLATFEPSNATLTQGFADTSADGGIVSAGLGARVVLFTIGARGRLGFFTGFRLYTIGGELGLRIPLGMIEPHFEAGAGYAAIDGFHGAAEGADALRAHGVNLRFGAGLDVYLTRWLSVGGGAGWDVLGLSRPALGSAEIAKLEASPGLTAEQRGRAKLLAEGGSSWGSGIAVVASAGLHF